MPQPSMIIQLVNSNESAEALDQQTQVLANDFRRLDGVTAAIPEGASPAGSRGDPISVGTIALAFMTGGGVTAIVQALGDWLRRGENRKVILKVSVDGDTVEMEFPSKGITQKEIVELTEKIKGLLVSRTKQKG